MMGMVRGCAAIVQESYPLMNPVHCFNYLMILALNKAYATREIQTVMYDWRNIRLYLLFECARTSIFSSDKRRETFTAVSNLLDTTV